MPQLPHTPDFGYTRTQSDFTLSPFQTTHDKVRNRALALIEEWKYDFESNPELGIMEECYNNLKAKSPSLYILSSIFRSRAG